MTDVTADDFEARFDALHRTAYRGAYRLLGNRDDAAEVAQETLARALVRWASVHPHAEAWVYRTATNLAIDRWRRRRRPVAAAPAAPRPERDAALRADLVDALRSLSPRQRDVVVLRYLLDLPEREVAAALGCTEGTVKQHARRGLARLRERLGPAYALEAAGAAPAVDDERTGRSDPLPVEEGG